MNFKKSIILFYLLSIVADGMSTYFASPDLAREFNPIVRVWNFGWLMLIAKDVAQFCLVSFLYWFTHTKMDIEFYNSINHPSTKIVFLKNYFLGDYYQNKRRYYFVHLNTQVNKAVLKLAGYVLITAFTLSRFFASIQNVLYGGVYKLGSTHWLHKTGLAWSNLNWEVSNWIGIHFAHPTFFIMNMSLSLLPILLACFFFKEGT